MFQAVPTTFPSTVKPIPNGNGAEAYNAIEQKLLATMIIGTQFFIAGFLGEIILRTHSHKERYLIKEELNF